MPMQSEPDDAAIRRRIDDLVAAVGARDLDRLRGLYAPDVVSFDVEPPLRHVGVAAKVSNWTRAFSAFRELAYDVRDLTVAVGGDIAFGHCLGRMRGTLNDGTPAGGMWVRGTFCLRKVGGTWLVVHDHASVPLDVRTGRGVTDLEP